MSQAEICRVCEGNGELEFIFSDEDPDVAEKLMTCANVQVDCEDTLPKYICLKCRQNLDFVYLFRIQCEETDRRLREICASGDHVLEIDEKLDELETSYENNEDKYLIISDPKEEEEEYLWEEYEDIEELVDDVEEDYPNESIGAYTAEDILCEDDGTLELEQAGNNSDSESLVKEEASATQEEYECSEINESATLENEFYSTTSVDGEKSMVEEPLDVKYNCELADKSEKIVQKNDIDANSKDAVTDTAHKKTKQAFFRCDTCGESVGSFVEFNLHKKTHGNHRYQCPVCMKWFSKRYRLKNHMAIHEESKSFCCEMCGNKYTNQGNLDRHIRHFHKKERPYMCTQCGLSFSRSNILNLHYTVHMNERNYECEICNKRFKAPYYLNLHKKSHVPIEDRRPRSRKTEKILGTQKKTSISCSYCGKKSASKALHISHVRIHTGEKPFECKTCNRKFAFRQSLKSHELLHTGEKPYRCELCGLAFRQIGHLKGHMLVHSGVKKHKCQFCDKAFGLKSNLVVHQRLHTGETPYHCNICNKKFYDSNGLKRHKHSHLKKKKELQEMQEIHNLVSLEPINSYFGEKEEYGEIIEMKNDEEIRLVDLGECN